MTERTDLFSLLLDEVRAGVEALCRIITAQGLEIKVLHQAVSELDARLRRHEAGAASPAEGATPDARAP